MELCKEFKCPAQSADTLCGICIVPSAASSIVAAAGSQRIELLSADTLCSVGSIGLKGGVKSIAASSADPNMLWSAGDDRIVRAWDVRTPKAAVRQLTSKFTGGLCSVASSGETGQVAAGTDVVKVDGENAASVLLWDVRGATPVVEYSDAHSDIVTNVCFSPKQPKYLCSGSLDGLVCITDTTVSDVDEALESVLNAESSVSQSGFFGPESEYAYCVTLTETVLFWHVEEAMRLGHHEEIRKMLETSSQIYVDYIVDCFYQTSSSQFTALAGSHSGNLHLLTVNLDGMELSSSLPKSHATTVRCMEYDDLNQVMYTGDERGSVCCWTSSRDAASAGAVEDAPATSAVSAAAAVEPTPKSAKESPKKHAKPDTRTAAAAVDHQPKGKRQQKSDRKYKPY